MRGLGLALLVCTAVASADDLGTIGPTYAISEPHLLDDLTRRLQAKQASGELAALQTLQRRRAEEAVRRPAPVAGLVATRVPRTFYFDPSVVLDHNILDADGRLLFAAGTRTNPLDIVSLSSPLLFFDDRDRRQRDHAQRLIAQYHGRLTPVLVGGSYVDLMQAWQRPVYFDQAGRLIERFGITQVPALVSQEGLRLRVDELDLPQ